MIRCKCGETDPAKFYPSTLARGKSGYCKACHVDYSRRKVEADRDHFLKHQRKRRRTVLDELAEIRAERGCERCGEKHPACLEFHHRDEALKKFSISQEAVRKNRKLEDLLEEIAKCAVLCANCHRKLHWDERSGPFRARKKLQTEQ